MIHAVNATGQRYSQYKRFCDSANFGLIPEGMFENQHELYCLKTEELTRESIFQAMNEKVATEVLKSEDPNSQFNGINILTDARHG